MKKLLVPVILLVVVASFSGCNKALEKLFNGIDVKVPDIVIPVPAIPVLLPNEMTLGTVSMSFNLDSVIKANTGNVFGINDVNSIKVKQYIINLQGGDQTTNLSNFETGRVELFSDSNPTKINVATYSFPDVPAFSTTIQAVNSPELLSYLRGSQLSYTMYGKARKITAKAVALVVSVTVEVR